MSTFTVEVTPGYELADGEEITNDILNAMATPTVQVAGAISSASIADGSVTNSKLAANAVDTVNITDANVTTSKLADLAVTTGKIDAGAVGSTQIAALGVATANLALLAVTEPTLGCATPATVSRKLRVAPANAAPLNKLTGTADEIVLRGTAISFRATAVNVTGDITGSGLNGLDTGTEANSTWYYLWVIYDDGVISGTPAVGSLLSLSSTAPTMPTNFTYKTLAGAVHNGSGGDFDHVITYGETTKFVSGLQVVTLATQIALAHNLGITPDHFQSFLECFQTGEAGYAVGDRIPCSEIYENSGFTPTAFVESANATNCNTIVSTAAAPVIRNATTGAAAVLALTGSSPTNWKLRCVAAVFA